MLKLMRWDLAPSPFQVERSQRDLFATTFQQFNTSSLLIAAPGFYLPHRLATIAYPKWIVYAQKLSENRFSLTLAE
jgi:hypothetical protein